MARKTYIELGEHKYFLPPLPPKKDILFHDSKKADQYWRRLEVPELVLKFKTGLTQEYQEKTKLSANGSYAETLSYSDTVALLEYREKDLKRREAGIWFMNNGEPEYITGGHYFQLQWGAMPGYTNPRTNLNYGEFRIFQRDVHYMLDLVRKDPDCAGVYIGKPKKTGITNLIAIDYVEQSTRFKEKVFAMMSKSEKDCKDTGFKYYEYCYDNLPDIFKPALSNRTQSEFKMGKPQVKNTGTKQAAKKIADMPDGLENHIFVSATKADGFDGPVVYLAWCDEFPKLADPYPGEVLEKAKETVKIGYRITGTLILSAYTPEDDSKSFEQAKDVWNNSALETKRGADRTVTTLYKYFISAADSYEEGDFTFDVYGYNDRERAIMLIMAGRAQRSDDNKKLQAFIRQYPLYEREMWEVGGGDFAAFDNVRLGKQLYEIEEFLKSGQLPYEMGNFRWVEPNKRIGREYGVKENNYEFGLVKWVPLTKDEISAGKTAPFRWNARELMDPASFNYPVKHGIKDRKGHLKPSEVPLYCMGIDPTDYASKSIIKDGSMDAIYAFMMPSVKLDNEYGEDVSDRPFLSYLHRHENPDDFLEDMIMAMLYLGCPIYLEGNKKWATHRMVEIGLFNFLVVRNKEKFLELYDPMKMTRGEQVTPDTVSAGSISVINDMIISLKLLMKSPEAQGDPDYVKKIWDVLVINQLMSFDPKKTQKFDLAMAFGFCSMLREAMLGWRVKNMRNKGASGITAKLFSALTKKDVPYTEAAKTTWGAK